MSRTLIEGVADKIIAMYKKVLQRSPYGTPLLLQIDWFHFQKLEDSVFYQCTAPKCKFRLLISQIGDSFTPEFLENSSHNHDQQHCFTIHLEYGKKRIPRLWYFNDPGEVVFASLMKRFLAGPIAPFIPCDSERVCCSLLQIGADGERATAEVAKKRPADGDEFVFFYRPTTAKRKETSDTVIVFDRVREQLGRSDSMSQTSNREESRSPSKSPSSENSQTTPPEPPPSPESSSIIRATELQLNYGSPVPSESGELSLSDLLDSVRVFFPITAKLISACLDLRERLLRRLREVTVLDREERTLGTLLLQSSTHIVRQTVTLEKMTLCSSSEEFYVPKDVCNATVCCCKHHPYPLRPCPQLFHFNYCKKCQRARRFHFYVKNCSGMPLEHIKVKAILFGTKVDSMWKMQGELEEIFARFATFLAEGNSDSTETRLSDRSALEKDLRTVRTYRSIDCEFEKCFVHLKE
uniref:Uncharacterized protein n=1 Tax=Steinernema glaseri TaxID=37863 RepID=A0A1I7ZP66_9BILA